MEIHGYPGIFINFQKTPGYYRVSGNPDFPDIHGNLCMPELPYMDIQQSKVGRDS